MKQEALLINFVHAKMYWSFHFLNVEVLTTLGFFFKHWNGGLHWQFLIAIGSSQARRERDAVRQVSYLASFAIPVFVFSDDLSQTDFSFNVERR